MIYDQLLDIFRNLLIHMPASGNGRGIRLPCGPRRCRDVCHFKPGVIVQQFIGHTGPVQAVTFSQDGQIVVTGSQDQTVRLWNAESGEVVRQFVGHVSPVHTVDLSDDGELLVTGDIESTYLWRVSLEDIVALTCEKIATDLTTEERALYEIHDDSEVCQVA